MGVIYESMFLAFATDNGLEDLSSFIFVWILVAEHRLKRLYASEFLIDSGIVEINLHLSLCEVFLFYRLRVQRFRWQ
jgi:hypothetical protein